MAGSTLAFMQMFFLSESASVALQFESPDPTKVRSAHWKRGRYQAESEHPFSLEATPW